MAHNNIGSALCRRWKAKVMFLVINVAASRSALSNGDYGDVLVVLMSRPSTGVGSGGKKAIAASGL